MVENLDFCTKAQGLAFIFTWSVLGSKWCCLEQQSSICYFWVSCCWQLHVLFESWIQCNAFCIYILSQQLYISFIFIILFYIGTIIIPTWII